MKKNILLSTIATVALVSFVGCGGGGGSTPPSPSANTGTGYYVDSAVKGVDYICGTQKGKTDKDGKFTFEKGKECSFELAGIILRKTNADELLDGAKIVETNVTVARFLQSIDNDNNASNGIQIEPKILTILTQALKDNNSSGKVPTDELSKVVRDIKDVVPTFEGEVKTPNEANVHLTQTQTEITKELLAGKTFYVAYNDNGVNILEKHSINSDVTSDTWQYVVGNTGGRTDTISISGSTLTATNSDDGTKETHTLKKVTDSYMEFIESNGDISKAYFKKADAEAVLGNSGTGSDDLTSLIVGKTYYVTENDSYTDENGNYVNNDHVSTLAFNVDGHTLTDTWTQNGETKTSTVNYSINNNSLNINGVNENGESFNKTLSGEVTQTDTYIQFANHDGRFFKTYAAAEAALGGTTGNDTKALLAGKTFYGIRQSISNPSDFGGRKLIFNQSLTGLEYTELYGDTAGATGTASFTVDGNKIKWSSTTDYNVVGLNRGDYIELNGYTSDGTQDEYVRLYFDKSKADAYVATLGT